MPTMTNMTLPIPNPDDWMTTRAVAQLLGVDRRTVDRLIDKGVLKRYQPYTATDETPPALIWREEALQVLSARTKLARATAAAS